MKKKFILSSLLIFFSCYFWREEKDPLYLYILYSRAYDQENYEKARRFIERLLKISKKKEYYRDYIFLLYKLKEYKKLKKVFFDYEKIFGMDSSLFYPFLSACVFVGDYKTFEKYEKKFREKFKKDKNLLYFSSLLYQTREEYDKALELIDNLMEIDSLERDKYIVDKIRILSQKKDYEKALELIEKVEEKGEVSIDLILEKAILFEGLNRYKEALLIYSKVFLITNNNVRLLKKIINLAIMVNDYEFADSLLSKYIDRFFYDMDLIHQYGFIKYMKEEYKKALEYFSIALVLNPKDDLAHYYLSRIFYREKMSDKAFYHIKKAIEINPRSEEYYVYYAFLLMTENKLKEAEYVLREMPNKGNATYYYLRGFLERERERFRRAIYFYKRSLEYDSLDAKRWFELGALYERINDIKNAERSFKRALKLDSTFSEVYNYWGYMLAERGIKLDTAKVLIAKALKYDPQNGYYLDSMGWVYYMMGKYDSAHIYLRQAVSLTPDDPVIIEHLGDVYLKLNDIEKALFYWTEALKLKPDNKDLKKKIEKYRRKSI